MNNSRSRSRSHSRSRSRSRVRAAASRSTTTTSNNIFKAVRKPSASTSDILPFAMSPTTPSLSSSSEDRSRFSSRPLFPDDDDDDAHGEDEDEEDDTDLGDYHDDEDEEDEEEDDGKSSASAKQPVNENVPTSSNSSTSSPSIHSLRKRTRRRRQPQSQQQQLQTRKHRTSSYSISPHSPLGVLLAPLSTSQDSSAGPSSYATTASSSSSPPSTCDTTATSPESTSHHSHGGSRNKAGGDVGTLFSLSSFPYNESHRHHQKRDSVDSTGSRSQRSGGGATTNRGAAHPSRTHHSRGSTRSNSMSTSRSECCSECGHQDGEGIMVRNLSADGSRGGGGSGAIHSRSSASSSSASSQVSAERSPLFPPLRPSSSSITTASLSNWNASSGGGGAGSGVSRGQQQQPSSPLSTPRMSSNTSLPSVAHQSTTSVATSTTNTVGTSIFSIPPPKSIRTLSGLSAGSSLTSNSSSTTDSSSAVSSKSGESSSTGSSISGSGSGSHVPPIPSPLRFLQGKQGGVGVGVGPPRLPSMGASFVSLTSSKPAEIIVHAAGGGGVPGVSGGTAGTGRSTSDTFGSAFSASARLLRSPTLYQSASSGDLMNAAAGGAGAGQSQGMQRSSSASTASATTTPGKSPPNGMGGANVVEGGVPTSPNYEADSPNTSAFSFSSASTITAANANAGIGSAGVDAGYTTAETSTSASARARGRSPSHILRRRVFSPSREPSCGLGLGPLADDDDEGESAETDCRPVGGSRKDERKFRTEPVNARHNGRRRSSIRAMGELMGFTASSSVDGGAAEGRDDGEGEEEEADDYDEEEEEDGRGRRSRRDDGIDRESYAARIYNIQQQMGGRLWSRFNLGGGSSSSSPSPTPSASTITAAGGTRTPDATGSSSYGHGRPSYGSSTTRAASPKRSLASLLPSAALSTMPAPRLSRTSTGSSSGGSSLLSGKSGSQSFESDLNANGEGGGGSRQRSSPTSRSQKTVGGGEGVDLHAQQRRNSHSSRLTNGLRSLVKLPNLLLGAVSVGAGEKDSSSSGASSGGGSTQQYVGSTTSPHRLGSSDGASSSLLAPSTTGSSGGGEPQRLSSSRSRKSFAESTRRMSSSSSSRASLNSGWGGRGVVSPLEGDSDPGAYVFGLGLPIDPDTELGSVVQLQTFRTGHGYPFNRSRTLSLDTGAAAAHREALARSSLDAEDGGSGPMDISGRGAAGSNITTASSSSSSSMREPPNVVHRGSVPEGKEVAELLAARKQGRDSLLSGFGSGSGSSASTRGKSPSSSTSSSDSLAGVAAIAPPPASDAGSVTSNASGGGAFWARPSRPAAEAVPQNYSAFRSRQRAGIKKVKDPVSPGPPSSGAGAGGLVSTLSSATNSSASLSTGSGSGSGGQSVRSGGSSELSADSSSLSSHDDDRTGPSSAEVGDSSRMGRLRIPYSASTVGASGSGAGVPDGGQSRSRDPSPPSQHAVGLYTGGGFCSPRRFSADEGLPPLSASGVRRTKSGSNYTRGTSVESRRARASHPTPEMHSDGGEEPAQFPPVVDESGGDDGEMDSRGAVSGRGRPKTNRSPTDSASSSLRGRGNGVKVVSASQGSSARSPSSNGNGSGSNNDAGQQGRNRSRLLSADIWKAAGSIAKPRPPQSAPSPSRKRASPSRKAKAIAPAGRLSSPPGFRPRMAPRPLPIGGPPPVMPRSSGPGGSGSRAMHAAAAAAASNGGVNSGSRPGGPQMSGSPGPGARLSLMSNNKHLLMLSLELEMMRKRKISAPLKPRAFVVRWIRQQAQQEGDEDEEGYDDEDEGEEEEEEDGAMGGLALERSNSSPPRMENQSSGRRTAHGGGHGHGHGNAIPAASDGMKTPEMRARIFLAGGSSLRYEVRPDASSGGGGGVSVS
ncbi:hypothetical protein CF327_g6732 [Tilletia walkeri]|nr:hypothetical protein CF327_g6732 [Tilletia walkeri]